MKYYQFNIEDYRSDTSGLLPMEHYIYRALLDECYRTELPLNDDIRELMRLLRVDNDQKEPLEYILGKFFELTDDGYINDKVNEVLSKTYDKSEQARAAVNKRWAKYERKKKPYDRNTDVEPANNGRNTTIPKIPNIPKDKKNNKGKRFAPPSPVDVQVYIQERGITRFDGETFCDFYIARNWQLSHGKQMSDWKAAVRTWANREKGDDSTSGPYAPGAI